MVTVPFASPNSLYLAGEEFLYLQIINNLFKVVLKSWVQYANVFNKLRNLLKKVEILFSLKTYSNMSRKLCQYCFGRRQDGGELESGFYPEESPHTNEECWHRNESSQTGFVVGGRYEHRHSQRAFGDGHDEHGHSQRAFGGHDEPWQSQRAFGGGRDEHGQRQRAVGGHDDPQFIGLILSKSGFSPVQPDNYKDNLGGQVCVDGKSYEEIVSVSVSFDISERKRVVTIIWKGVLRNEILFVDYEEYSSRRR